MGSMLIIDRMLNKICDLHEEAYSNYGSLCKVRAELNEIKQELQDTLTYADQYKKDYEEARDQVIMLQKKMRNEDATQNNIRKYINEGGLVDEVIDENSK